jgi:hypothetical protein
MKYVLDSNVALKWVLPEPDADKAIQVRDDLRRGVTELYLPTSSRSRSLMPSRGPSGAESFN